MKQVFSSIVLVLCITIYGVSLSEPLTKKIATYKYQTNSIWRSDKYRFGDLFGLSYYPGLQIPITKKALYPMERCDTSKKTVDLYALCDSYLGAILPSDTFYCNVDKLRLATINHFDYLRVQLDTTKVNILLLEFTERNTLYMLKDNFTYLTEFLTTDDSLTASARTPPSDIDSYSFLFNKNINSNLEFNLYETAIFTYVKKMKAVINFDFLKTPNQDVAIGPDKKYLLYQPTVDSFLSTSSFKSINDTEIDSVVNKLNLLYFHYKQMGFREVYFSIIPNPVTILYPDYNGYKYNHLIPRIQNHGGLKISVIDVYSDFKKANFPIYYQSDSHWNRDGAFIWLNKFNNILRRIEK